MLESRNRSQALDRPLDDWLHRIGSGQLRLPSFQRGVAWEKDRVSSMLTTIIKDLPLGITLVLDVGDKEQFHSRPLLTAPETDAKVTEHLLDGQQRLTALWRALKDNSEVTYFVHVPEFDEDPDNDDLGVTVVPIKRRVTNTGKRPVWADHPEECRRRGLVPVRLLDPDSDEVDQWLLDAYPSPEVDDSAGSEEAVAVMRKREAILGERDQLKKVITPLRERVRHYNLPYLRLPATTEKETALRVFINMNTNAKPLKAYDIVVAELENQTGRRLSELLGGLVKDQPTVNRYFSSLGDAVLQVSALMQGRVPNQRGFFELDLDKFVEDWDLMAHGLRRLTELLVAEGIMDAARVPTGPALPVAAALLSSSDETGDKRAAADRLARRYLWSSFFTSRYQNSAGTRSASDYSDLLDVLQGRSVESKVTIFNREQYPLPSLRELLAAKWPKKADRLGRAVLATSTYFGARDFADDTKISPENINRREYHHLFPEALLKEVKTEPSLALNCALITGKTNRTIGRLSPLKYLNDRVERAPDPRDVPDRLRTHLVPHTELSQAGPYADDLTDSQFADMLRADFDVFLHARADLVLRLAEELAAGNQPHLGDLFD